MWSFVISSVMNMACYELVSLERKLREIPETILTLIFCSLCAQKVWCVHTFLEITNMCATIQEAFQHSYLISRLIKKMWLCNKLLCGVGL